MDLEKAFDRVPREVTSVYIRKKVVPGQIIIEEMYNCDQPGRNQSHVGRVRFPLRAEMHGRAHISDSCFIAFITSKIC